MLFAGFLRVLLSPLAAVMFLIVVSLLAWGSARATSNSGTILVDNHIDTRPFAMGETFDDAQGFTTGPDDYLLSGVEITLEVSNTAAVLSLSISEPTNTGEPGTTLYQLRSPTLADGRNFFSAPSNALLLANTEYLLRIDVTYDVLSVHFTDSSDETDLGFAGWSIADYFLTSSGAVQGIEWTQVQDLAYAITVRGSVLPDRHGSTSYTAGRLAFSRYTGKSPTEGEAINFAGDTDWFDTTLAFDYGGRYRIDVEPVSLTNDDDIGVRAFYVDYPHDHSLDKTMSLTSVADPPEGYVSWHFEAGRNYGPYIEVYADNDTTGVYRIRVVYDPERVWTGTEVVRGDLPHDDTSWAAIEVDADESEEGIYHYYEDHDWYEVVLESDTSYKFLAIGSGQYSSYIDPAIWLYDDAGNELASSYISHGDSSATSVSIDHQVGTGDGGTYYIDVSNAVLMDDATKLANLGLTEPFEIFSPFIGTRYHVQASEIDENNMRSLRGVQPANSPPRIHNRRGIALEENSYLGEYIAAHDNDADDAITGYEISGGEDRQLFSISDGGALTMRITPDYEIPADQDMDNVYEVSVTVESGSDGRSLSTTAEFTVTVTDDESEAERVLLSNTGQRVKGNAKVNNSVSATRLHTGPNPDGYVITSVALKLGEPLEDADGIEVTLRSSHTPTKFLRPNQEIFAFTNPRNIYGGLVKFAAPADTVLDPDTSYFILIKRTGDDPILLENTPSDAEDAIGEPRWSVGSLRFYRTNKWSGPWGNSNIGSDKNQVLLRVTGYERTAD